MYTGVVQRIRITNASKPRGGRTTAPDGDYLTDLSGNLLLDESDHAILAS